LHWISIYPKAKLLIDTPVNTISARGGSRTDQIFLSIHSLLTIISDEKPKSTDAIKANHSQTRKEPAIQLACVSEHMRQQTGKQWQQENQRIEDLPKSTEFFSAYLPQPI
jgi:hypothetical protein